MQHPVGYAVLANSVDATIYNSNADWVAPVASISPTTSCGTGTPPCKVNINDSDHSYYGMWNDTAQGNRNYLWENSTSGDQVLFMDPYVVYYPRENRNLCGSPVDGICSAPGPRWENFRSNLGYARAYANRMDLVAMTPQGNLSSPGYVLANTNPTGSEFLVYSPNGGTFTVNLSNTTSTLNVEWFNPSTGVATSLGSVAGGSSSQSFTPPFSGDAVLYLVEAQPDTQPPTAPTGLGAVSSDRKCRTKLERLKR